MTQQIPLFQRPPAAIQRGETYLAFSGDTDPDEAAAIYRARFGREPGSIFNPPGRSPQLWLGPVPEHQQ